MYHRCFSVLFTVCIKAGLWILVLLLHNTIIAQCSLPISTFPYNESFESSNGNWTAGGVGNDWAWGTPAKTTIQAAGGGNKCWITGGLTSSSYTDGEASWLQSPCFDFTSLPFPYIAFKINWQTEQQFDGASFQYSADNGNTWTTLGPANHTDCYQKNWFNQDPVTYLSALTTERRGWSGNNNTTSGSCRGGNGSNGWVIASTIAPGLGSRPSVIFRFIFGAGTICNNYDGVAIDDIYIGNAPPTPIDYTFSCSPITRLAAIFQSSANCFSNISWDFGDPASGTANSSSLQAPLHTFSAPGTYQVTLSATDVFNSTVSTTKEITVLGVTASLVTAADCNTNMGGAAAAIATGTSNPVTYTWNTTPVQSNTTASNLSAGSYKVAVAANDACPDTTSIVVPLDNSCIDIYFPSAFTPNNDGRNDGFGALGGTGTISRYKLEIYNRWGEQVFRSGNPSIKWDGLYKGVRQDAQVFLWRAVYTLQTSQQINRKGTVVLIR